MRLSLLFAAPLLLAAPAFAADAPPASPAEPPICTTVTTVVKRGDVVLSTNSTTKCEDPAHPGGGGGGPGGVLQAPAAVLAAPAKLFEGLGEGRGDLLTERNTIGDWQVVHGRNGDICHVVLSGQTTAAGYAARNVGCRGELAATRAWIYRDGAAELLKADGHPIARLTGSRDQLKGATEGGEALTFHR